jgi:hypothetical protein
MPMLCRWCERDFVYDGGLWDHARRVHPEEFVRAVTRPTGPVVIGRCELCGDAIAVPERAVIKRRYYWGRGYGEPRHVHLDCEIARAEAEED